jgi:hypothetical protein
MKSLLVLLFLLMSPVSTFASTGDYAQISGKVISITDDQIGVFTVERQKIVVKRQEIVPETGELKIDQKVTVRVKITP